MTASLKLKVESRLNLYYGKYKYRVVVKEPGLWYLPKLNTIDEFKNAVKKHGFSNQRLYKTLTDDHYARIEKILAYLKNFKSSFDGSFRTESNTISFFTNDDNILTSLDSIMESIKSVTQAMPMPTGIKYMRDPEHSYRVYLKNKREPIEIKSELFDYIQRTPDVHGSKSLMCYLTMVPKYAYLGSYTYLHSSYFIDYDDPKTLMMMHILFPGIIGKTYKLEKKEKK